MSDAGSSAAGEGGAPDAAAGEGGAPEQAGAGSGGASGTAGGGGTSGTTARCDSAKPFASPTYVASVSSEPHFEASLTADGLTMLVWEGDALATAKRSSGDGAFGAPVRDPLMDTAAARFALSQSHELPTISADQLFLYSEFGGQGNVYIHAARRSTVTDAFDMPAAVPSLADASRGQPFSTGNGRALYFRMSGHLHFAVGDADGFGLSTPLATLDSPELESDPVPSSDELVIYFASERADGDAKGGLDIWTSRRSAVSEEFDPPHAEVTLNTTGHDKPVWVSPDDCEIFLIRYIPDNLGGTTPRVMSARRPR